MKCDLSNNSLAKMSKRRREEDLAIKTAIKDEFKAVFKNEGEGLDLYENSGCCVYGMLDASGEIGKMYLNSEGEIMVTLIQEYEDFEEDFESRYFACEDWPQLLLLVRDGIEKKWYIQPEE